MYTMEYYSSIKNEILPFVTAWMDLEGIMLSEISQTEQILYGSIYIRNLKKQTHRHREQTDRCQLGGTLGG